MGLGICSSTKLIIEHMQLQCLIALTVIISIHGSKRTSITKQAKKKVDVPLVGGGKDSNFFNYTICKATLSHLNVYNFPGITLTLLIYEKLI